MKYQTILGNSDETRVHQLMDRCPQTESVFSACCADLDAARDRTITTFARENDLELELLCRDLFDVYIQNNPLENLPTNQLIDMIDHHYEEWHHEELPRLHRLARKIEAVHRASPEVPEGLTLAVKKLEQLMEEHVSRERHYVFEKIRDDQPPGADTPIFQMNEEHSGIKEQLQRIRTLTRHYRIPDAACRSWKRLYEGLKSLDASLSEQIFLEREILFPRFQF